MSQWMASVNAQRLRSECYMVRLARDLQCLEGNLCSVQHPTVNTFFLRGLSSIHHVLMDVREVFSGW